MTKIIEIDWKELDALLQFKVTKRFVCDYIRISEDTLERRIKDRWKMTFSEYHDMKMARTGLKLQQKAIEMALKGDKTMLIFALKNMAKWSDKIEEKVTLENIHINIDNDDAKL